MRKGWNPTRRSRKIGTKSQGIGQRNVFVVPTDGNNAMAMFERLNDPRRFTRIISGRSLRFLVEPTNPGNFHPCTPDDICKILECIPANDLAAFEFVVLRQPTRKQKILSPVWGRSVAHAEHEKWSVAAVVLDAQTLASYRWGKSLTPEMMLELKRLRDDGHVVSNNKRGFEVGVTAKSLRETLLYRTLIHEIGHHVDRARFSFEAWSSRATLLKEDFAHRYTERILAELKERGVVPFREIISRETLLRDGLDRAWFQAE